MKRWLLLMLFCIAPTAVIGGVSITVYKADGTTPLELADPNSPNVYRDIMVGTKLTIMLSSDTGGFWEGGFFITGDERDSGMLLGRDYNIVTSDWRGSRFAAAGKRARVWDRPDDFLKGFEFYGDREAIAGNWFVIDYRATQTGDCTVQFYDYTVSLDKPISRMSFHHVPTRDFDGNGIVNFVDFALLAPCWFESDPNEPMLCPQANIDGVSGVDLGDLALFCEHWLETTE